MDQRDGVSNSGILTEGNFSPGAGYDIIIVGAGPAGLNAALHIVQTGKGFSVLLADMVVPWEQPIQCAEAVGRRGFEEAIDVKPSWIRQVINKACFHAPDDTTITYTDKNGGYIIDRAAMQHDIILELVKNGVTCLFRRRVVRLGGREGSKRAVAFADGETVFGRVVVDASGPVACLGKNESVAWKPPDLEPAYFVHARGAGLPTDTVHIYTGEVLAPGGYAWVFPRGPDAANIGVLIGSAFKGRVNIHRLFDTFLASHFPGISIVNRFSGAIPCGYQRGPLSAPGLIKTGDAASTVNPVSRAGISEAMLSGGLAGDHALLMLGATTKEEMRRIGKSYENAWNKKRGTRHDKLAKVKKSLAEVPDADYNRAARALAHIPQDELTMSKIFRTALGRFPRLVWALRHLM